MTTTYTSRLNFSFNRIAFSDGGVVGNNPTLRSFDWVTQESSIPVRDTYSFDSTVLPGQSVSLKSSERTLFSDTTTTMKVDVPVLGNDVVRYRYTGTGASPVFRTNRSLGIDATTQLTVALSGNSAAVVTCTGGTSPTFNNIQVGDSVYIQPSDNVFVNSFSVSNTSVYPGVLYTVIDKNSSSFTIRNPGNLVPETVLLGSSYADSIRVFSSVGVQINDSIMFDSTCNLNIQNKAGQFDVFMVTDRDLYVLNTSAVINAPVALGGISGSPIRVFSDIISFIAIDADGEITLRLNNNPTSDITLYCYQPNKAMFAGTMNVTSIMAINNTSNPVTVRINTASF